MAILSTGAILKALLVASIALTSAVAATDDVYANADPNDMIDIDFEDAGDSTYADGHIRTAVIRLKKEFYDFPPAEIEISAPGFRFGRNKFVFNKYNRNSYQQRVMCRSDAGSDPTRDGSTLDVDVYVRAKDRSYANGSKDCTTKKIKRKVRNSGRCWGTGDPHLVTLDGVAYDFQKAGVFKLFQSRNFQVQVFQEKCAPTAHLGEASPSCYQGVAVAFGASVARFFIQNGKIEVAKGTNSLQWLSVEKLGGTTDGYRIFTAVDQSTYVDINLGVWINNYPYLNVAVQASPYFKDATVSGLMGNWNGNPADDITDNNILATTYGTSLTDNLFTCSGTGCIKFLQPGSITDAMALSLPNQLPLLHQGYTPLAAASIALKAFAPALVQPPTAPVKALRRAAGSDVYPRAVELCNQVISSMPVCDKYVGNKDYFINKVCVADAALLQDLSVVDSTKLSYLRECRRELDARIAVKTTSADENQTLLSERAGLKFGDLSTCANSCSGRGSCLSAGCKCDAGFTGFACEIAV